MRKFILAVLGLAFAFNASAQFYYQDATNVDMLRHSRQTAAERTEIILPQVNGYNVYKADLHLHTIYSDGDVTPEYRVREAWNDGLDVVASTEHVEYRRHEGKMISFLKGYVVFKCFLCCFSCIFVTDIRIKCSNKHKRIM